MDAALGIVCGMAGLAVFCFSPNSCPAASTARDIMQQVESNQNRSAEFVQFDMVLIDKSGFNRRRTVREYRRRAPDGLSASLIFFDDPPDIRGSALLSKERADGWDDQWLYLPAVGKIRRIADSGRTDYFLGSDLTFEDFSVEDINRFEYRFASADTIVAGWPVHVIDAAAVDSAAARRSGYGVRRVMVDAERFVILQTDYFDRDGKRIKTLWASDVTRHGGVWRADRLKVDNERRSHRTEIVVSRRMIDAIFPPDLFTPRTLQSGAVPEIAGHPTRTTP